MAKAKIKPRNPALRKSVVSSSENKKFIEKRYFYYHGHDCYIYETICGNCKAKVGGWSEYQANEAWDNHCC